MRSKNRLNLMDKEKVQFDVVKSKKFSINNSIGIMMLHFLIIFKLPMVLKQQMLSAKMAI